MAKSVDSPIWLTPTRLPRSSAGWVTSRDQMLMSSVFRPEATITPSAPARPEATTSTPELRMAASSPLTSACVAARPPTFVSSTSSPCLMNSPASCATFSSAWLPAMALCATRIRTGAGGAVVADGADAAAGAAGAAPAEAGWPPPAGAAGGAGAAGAQASAITRSNTPLTQLHLGMALLDRPHVIRQLHAAEGRLPRELLQGRRRDVARRHLFRRRAVVRVGLHVHGEEAHRFGREPVILGEAACQSRHGRRRRALRPHLRRHDHEPGERVADQLAEVQVRGGGRERRRALHVRQRQPDGLRELEEHLVVTRGARRDARRLLLDHLVQLRLELRIAAREVAEHH